MVTIDGIDYIELSRDEALSRFAAAWKANPDAPLKVLYQGVYAAMKEAVERPASVSQTAPSSRQQKPHFNLLPSVKIGSTS
jgi:hypothetical protein